MKIKWLVEIFFVALIALPLALLPYAISLRIGGFLGVSLFYLWNRRRKIAIDNIDKSGIAAQNASHSLAQESFANLGRSLAEIFKVYFGLGRSIIDNIEIQGIENFEKAAGKKRGVILITGHCGNWELMAITLAVRVAPVSVVVRGQNNPLFDKFIKSVRLSHGNQVIYKQGALKKILTELKKSGNVGILIDQAVVKDEGYITDFLGRKAWSTKMPALIARKTGTPIVPIFIHREGSRHTITFHSEMTLSGEPDRESALTEDTQKLTTIIENHIRQHPSEWLWMHKRWKRAGN